VGRVNNSGAGPDGRRKASPAKKKVSNAKVVDRAPRTVVRRATTNGGTNRRNGGRGRSGRDRRALGRPFHGKPSPERKVIRVLDLDPLEKCGRGTSVQRLIRVDEMINQDREAHLVFFDRHGWYCEHGPTCPAVGHARKHAERGARSH
jgi:hypothetical protein